MTSVGLYRPHPGGRLCYDRVMTPGLVWALLVSPLLVAGPQHFTLTAVFEPAGRGGPGGRGGRHLRAAPIP